MKARCLGQRQAGGNRGQVDLMDVTAPGYATSYTFDDGAAPAAPAEHVGLPSPGEVLRMNGGGRRRRRRRRVNMPRAPAGMVPRALQRQAPRIAAVRAGSGRGRGRRGALGRREQEGRCPACSRSPTALSSKAALDEGRPPVRARAGDEDVHPDAP